MTCLGVKWPPFGGIKRSLWRSWFVSPAQPPSTQPIQVFPSAIHLAHHVHRVLQMCCDFVLLRLGFGDSEERSLLQLVVLEWGFPGCLRLHILTGDFFLREKMLGYKHTDYFLVVNLPENNWFSKRWESNLGLGSSDMVNFCWKALLLVESLAEETKSNNFRGETFAHESKTSI